MGGSMSCKLPVMEILPELPLYTDATRKAESPQLLRIKNFYKLFEE